MSRDSYNLGQWLAWLEQLHPREIDLGLDRVRQVYERLGAPRVAKQVLIAGGTNGKGSTLAMLDAILSGAGFRVGRYSSPHLLRYNERIQIQGQMASDAEICAAFGAVDQARGDTSLTYFEFGTLAAFWLFARAGLDYGLLEVGMGGRLDAVNILEPELSIITSIALDHEAWLGSDREAIGFEKAGIMRAGKTTLCGDAQPPQSVLDRAQRLGARLLLRDQDFGWFQHQGTLAFRGQAVEGERVWEGLPDPGLPLDNMATALQALWLFASPVTLSQVKTALSQVRLPGRYQRVNAPVPTVLDVAHNPQASEYLAAKLREEAVDGQRLAVMAVLRDKDSGKILQPLLPWVDRWLVCELPAARAKPAIELAAELRAAGAGEVETFASVAQALQQAYEGYGKQDFLVVFGSFYTVTEAMNYLKP